MDIKWSRVMAPGLLEIKVELLLGSGCWCRLCSFKESRDVRKSWGHWLLFETKMKNTPQRFRVFQHQKENSVCMIAGSPWTALWLFWGCLLKVLSVGGSSPPEGESQSASNLLRQTDCLKNINYDFPLKYGKSFPNCDLEIHLWSTMYVKICVLLCS